MPRVKYGTKVLRNSKFIIVAPHAGGDDLHTKELAEEIARLVDGSVIINEEYVQKTSTRSYQNPYVEDFNDLPFSDEQHEYLWNKRHPDMKAFYADIKELTETARKYGNGKAIIIYIHGMDDNETNLGIDIGFGAKYFDGKLKGAREHPDAQNNNGEIRSKPEDIEKLRALLADKLKADYLINVGIGERFAAWSRHNGVQYHFGTSDYSFQLEISQFLRKPQRIKYSSQLIADAVKAVYK